MKKAARAAFSNVSAFSRTLSWAHFRTQNRFTLLLEML